MNPGPTSFTSGDVSGKVYRYVVWRDDPNCQMVPNSTIDACPGPHDYKRVVVIVKLEMPRSRSPARTPRSSPTSATRTHDSNQPRPGAGGAFADRPAVLPLGHDLQQLGSTGRHTRPRRAPDLGNLRGPESAEAGRPLHGGPTRPGPERPGQPAALRLRERRRAEPESRPGQGPPATAPGRERLQLQRRRQPPVQDPSLGEPAPGAGFQMSGQATLEFYTRTINDVNAQGTICVFVFIRKETAAECSPLPPPRDTQLIDLTNPPNAFFVYSKNPWPAGAWTRGRVPDELLLDHGADGAAGGVEIAVRRNGTTGDVLQFMYDHPDYPSRLEVKTSTPLPEGLPSRPIRRRPSAAGRDHDAVPPTPLLRRPGARQLRHRRRPPGAAGRVDRPAARGARGAERRSPPTTTCRCSPGCSCAAAAATAASRSRPLPADRAGAGRAVRGHRPDPRTDDVGELALGLVLCTLLVTSRSPTSSGA